MKRWGADENPQMKVRVSPQLRAFKSVNKVRKDMLQG